MPGDAVLFAAATKPAFVDDPPDRLEPLSKGMIDETISRQAAKPVTPRHCGCNIAELFKDPLSKEDKSACNEVRPTNRTQLIPYAFDSPPDLATEQRIGIEVRKATRQPRPFSTNERVA